MLRQESLDAVLTRHGYYQRSLKGLREAHPFEYVAFQRIYIQVEAYAELDVMVHKEGIIDRDFQIWIKPGHYAHAIEKKKVYNRTETEIFAQKFSIPFAEFEEIAVATGTMLPPNPVVDLSSAIQGPVSQQRTIPVGSVTVTRTDGKVQ